MKEQPLANRLEAMPKLEIHTTLKLEPSESSESPWTKDRVN